MATQPSDPDALREPCPGCERDAVHEVSVVIRTESDEGENAQFSREPYRVARCTECGTERATRMNSA